MYNNKLIKTRIKNNNIYITMLRVTWFQFHRKTKII